LAAPMPLGRVSRTAKKERISLMRAGAQNLLKRLVSGPVALTVAPARHDERARKDVGAFSARPAHGVYKLIRTIGVPRGKEHLGMGRQCMNNFAAQDAVLAIADFQVAVAAKGRGLHMLGQCLPELVSVITKARIQDGNLDAPAGKARRMPPIRAEPSQE